MLKYARLAVSSCSIASMARMQVWEHLPIEVQQAFIDKQLHFYVIDAHQVARETGMGGRINTVMQTCFFAISGILPREEAIEQIKQSIKKTYSKRGEAVVQTQLPGRRRDTGSPPRGADTSSMEASQALDWGAGAMKRCRPQRQPGTCSIALPMLTRRPPVAAEAPDFVRERAGTDDRGRRRYACLSARCPWTAPIRVERHAGRNAISRWRSRSGIPRSVSNVANASMVCPHAVIREKVYDPRLTRMTRRKHSYRRMRASKSFLA